MIPLEPDLIQVGEAVILGNQLGRQVAVIVENGLSGGEAVIKLAREFGIQQKVIGHEGGHSLAPYESAR
ncbi:hypothetical protein D3C81_2137890 [compost metagenome]